MMGGQERQGGGIGENGESGGTATAGYSGTYLPVKQFRFTIEKRRLGGRVIDS